MNGSKNFVAGTVVPPRSFLKFGADDNTLVITTAATDEIVGISPSFQVEIGERIDAQAIGFSEVKIGGAVTRGANLTSNASGQAISATTAGNRLGAKALASGVSGDIIPVVCMLGVL